MAIRKRKKADDKSILSRLEREFNSLAKVTQQAKQGTLARFDKEKAKEAEEKLRVSGRAVY